MRNVKSFGIIVLLAWSGLLLVLAAPDLSDRHLVQTGAIGLVDIVLIAKLWTASRKGLTLVSRALAFSGLASAIWSVVLYYAVGGVVAGADMRAVAEGLGFLLASIASALAFFGLVRG